MEHEEVTTTEIMEFLQKHLVTREEMEQIIDEKVTRSESNVLQSIDRFAKLHETLDQELVMLRSKYNRLEERLEIVESRLGITA